jgi:hypothetical protein
VAMAGIARAMQSETEAVCLTPALGRRYNRRAILESIQAIPNGGLL